jgi:guanine deaminase
VSSQLSDEELLARAVSLAVANAAQGQLPFGALVVRSGAVLATGVNTALRDHDPTAHAELAAIRAACKDLKDLQLTGATVVSSSEPCAMCHAASLVAGAERIIYAAPKEVVPDLGVPFPRIVVEMQALWRRSGSDRITYVPTRAPRSLSPGSWRAGGTIEARSQHLQLPFWHRFPIRCERRRHDVLAVALTHARGGSVFNVFTRASALAVFVDVPRATMRCPAPGR